MRDLGKNVVCCMCMHISVLLDFILVVLQCYFPKRQTISSLPNIRQQKGESQCIKIRMPA